MTVHLHGFHFEIWLWNIPTAIPRTTGIIHPNPSPLSGRIRDIISTFKKVSICWITDIKNAVAAPYLYAFTGSLSPAILQNVRVISTGYTIFRIGEAILIMISVPRFEIRKDITVKTVTRIL